MKSMIGALTLLIFILSATAVSADRGYDALVQQTWMKQQAEQVKAETAPDAVFAAVAKGIPAVPMPSLTAPPPGGRR